MKKKSFVVLFVLVCLTLSSASAALHTSVPLDHRVYRILDVAEIRGLIGRQVATRPFSAQKVMTLLEQMEGQKTKLTQAELDEVQALLKEFSISYGVADSGMKDLLKTGFLRTYDEEKNIGASAGINLQTAQTFSLVSKELDSRNAVVAFLKGDVGDNISFNMNFGLQVDMLNNNVFLPTEFTIPGEGFYMQLIGGGSQLRTIPTDEFYTGLVLSPELAASFFDGAVNLRWGSIKRDWGPGLNNLMLSGSARTFDGVEIQVDATSWLRYTVINGSLGKFSLDTLGGEPFFSDDYQQDKPYYTFDNNFSAHRVEVDFTKNLTFSIFESTVWQKRFELAYLNPLAIYMFQQNSLGDIDDVLAGMDINYTFANKARIYGALATSEMHDLGMPWDMVTAPRNILAFQAGAVIPLPIGSFSSLTLQWTYLAPFFYSHYPIMEKTGTLVDTSDTTYELIPSESVDSGDANTTYVLNPIVNNTVDTITSSQNRTYTLDGTTLTINDKSGSTTIDVSSGSSWYAKDGRIEIKKDGDTYNIYETTAETSYVNKGEGLGYPLNPNSQEFLLQLDLGLPQGWTTQSTVKYQVRSGQYGYTIEQYMNYGEYGSYETKAFWENVFEHSLTLQMQVAKKMSDMPIEVSANYRFTSVWERPITSADFDGRNTVFGDWKDPSFDHVLSVGAKIYF